MSPERRLNSRLIGGTPTFTCKIEIRSVFLRDADFWITINFFIVR